MDEVYYSDFIANNETYGNSKGRPVLLHLGSGDGLVVVATTHLNFCSSATGIEIDPQMVTSSKRLAFEQKVFEKCNFFELDLTVDPKILLDNPHWIADKMNAADVVLLSCMDPDLMVKLIPLLAKLSSKRERKIVTLINHFPGELCVHPNYISGTNLCICKGVIDNGAKDDEFLLPAPPQPLCNDDLDKDFARRSIQYAIPSNLKLDTEKR